MCDKYEYENISELSKQVAIEKLKENPSQINEQINQLREWAISMPHLNCPTDSNFLLRFLRVAKFDLKRAQKQLDSFCTIRCSQRGNPEYFNYPRIDSRMIDEFLDSQILTPLSRNESGEIIIYVALKNWNPEKIPVIQWTMLMFMGFEVIESEEETQIHGVRIFYDLTDASVKVMEATNNKKYVMEMARCFQDIFPWRLKSIVFYNESDIYKNIMKMVFFFFNKITGRIIRTNNLETVFEQIPGLKDILPTEYGGCGGPLKPYTERWNKYFKSHYKDSHPFEHITVDELNRHDETINYLSNYPDYEE